jgi:hypothetical protein
VEFQTMKLFTCLSRNKNQQRNVARVQRNWICCFFFQCSRGQVKKGIMVMLIW